MAIASCRASRECLPSPVCLLYLNYLGYFRHVVPCPSVPWSRESRHRFHRVQKAWSPQTFWSLDAERAPGFSSGAHSHCRFAASLSWGNTAVHTRRMRCHERAPPGLPAVRAEVSARGRPARRGTARRHPGGGPTVGLSHNLSHLLSQVRNATRDIHRTHGIRPGRA